MIHEIDVMKSEVQKGIVFLCHKEYGEDDWEVPLVLPERVAIQLLEALEKMFPK